MSIKQFPVNFKGYHNGDAGLIYPNSSAMLNCRLNHHDAIEQIKGYDLYKQLSTTGVIDNVWQFGYVYLSGALAGTQAKDLFVNYTPTGIILTPLLARINAAGTLTNVATNFTSNQMNAVAFLNNMVACNEGGSMVFLSGEGYGLTTLSVAPGFPYYTTPHYSRLFIADNRYTLNWSDVDTIHTWPVANTLNIQQDDGDNITGLMPYKGDLYVFKHNFVYKIIGNNFNVVSGNFSTIKMEGIPGAINQKAICVANGNMYWVSQQYIVEFNGSSFEYIDYPYLIDDRTSLTYAVSTQEPFLLQHNEKEHEIIFLKRGTDTFWAYDYLQKQWSKHSINTTTMNIQSICEFVNTTSGAKNIVFGSDAGKVFNFGDYDQFLNSVAAHVAIPVYYETDWMDMGTWQRKCATRVIIDTKQDGFLSAHPYSLSCSVYYDYDTVAVDTNVFACDGATNQFHDIYPEVQTFRRIKLRFANNVLDTKMQVNRAVIEYDLVDESGRI